MSQTITKLEQILSSMTPSWIRSLPSDQRADAARQKVELTNKLDGLRDDQLRALSTQEAELHGKLVAAVSKAKSSLTKVEQLPKLLSALVTVCDCLGRAKKLVT